MKKFFDEYIKPFFYFSPLSVVVQWLSNVFLNTPYFRYWNKTEIVFVGSKPDPKKNYLIVSNHRSYADPPLMGFSIGLPVAFVAKQELFKNPILHLYMILTSTISIDRENPESQTFKAIKKALNSNSFGLAWSVGIFIEGTRSKVAGMLGHPNKGPIFIARMNKVPIIPMGISYREGRKLIVKIGEPYEIDYKRDLDEQAWECLEKISELSDYKMPEKI